MKECPDHSITSMEAFKKFGATRLADVVYRLKNKGYNIVTIDEEGVNRYGEPTRYARYRLDMRSIQQVEGK
jgi:hypothetical protein